MSCIQWQACGSCCPNRVKETNPHHASFHADTREQPRTTTSRGEDLLHSCILLTSHCLPAQIFQKAPGSLRVPTQGGQENQRRAAGGSLLLLLPEFWKQYFKESCNPARQLPLIQQNCCSSRNCYHIAGKCCL